jgi:hypothetical protein
MSANEKDLLFLLQKSYEQLLNVKEESVAQQDFKKAENYRDFGQTLKRLIGQIEQEAQSS